MSAAAVDAGLEIGLLVELDTGLRRLGRAPGKDGADLGEAIASLPGVWLEGRVSHTKGTSTVRSGALPRRSG